MTVSLKVEGPRSIILQNIMLKHGVGECNLRREHYIDVKRIYMYCASCYVRITDVEKCKTKSEQHVYISYG